MSRYYDRPNRRPNKLRFFGSGSDTLDCGGGSIIGGGGSGSRRRIVTGAGGSGGGAGLRGRCVEQLCDVMCR
jgi:hypothetical protein